jgi:hypothetical protein
MGLPTEVADRLSTGTVHINEQTIEYSPARRAAA